MNTKKPDLGNEKLGTLMRRFSIPCIVSLLVAALYNIVDQIFIANSKDLGSFGNAANTVVFPLTVIALAVAVMIGDGACAYVSLSLGRGEPDKAGKSVGTAIVLSVLSGVVLMTAYLLFADPLLTLFGGRVNEQTFKFSKEYFFWIALGIPFYVFGQAMNPIIRADGAPKTAMTATLLGAAVNLILDPVFIYPLHMGMTGAAVATVLGQVLTAVISLWYLFRLRQIKLDRASFRLTGNITGKTLSLGLCSFLSQISLVAAMAAINNMVREYGALDPIFGQEAYAQIPMAVVGIVMKVFQIVISIVVGMAAGTIPVVGFNVGAGRNERVRKLFYLLLSAEAAVGALALLIVECFPKLLIGIFGAANESVYYADFAVKAFRIYLCMMVFACVNKAAFIFLQAMGKAFASTALSMLRELVFGVGFALLLPRFFGLYGVLYSMPVSDALTFIVTVLIVLWTTKRLKKPTEAQASAK